MASYTLTRPVDVEGVQRDLTITTDDRVEFERLYREVLRQPMRALDLDRLEQVVEQPVERLRRNGRPVTAVQIPFQNFVKLVRVLDATGMKHLLPAEFPYPSVQDLVETTKVDLEKQTLQPV